ncbi:hypothetical protein HDU97_009666 [Phlyctochytrium planicorne]|nr:hypothetical protein HDU97_009666 [Phlyctochytrium planicorne]
MRRRIVEEEDEDESSSDSSEDDSCDICKGHGTLILCDGKVGGEACDIQGVHLKCYKPGTQVPEGDWLCDRCSDNVPLSELKVVCCPSTTGIVRRTNMPGQYIHAVCALWNPSLGIDQGDSPIRIDNVLLTTGKPCSMCPKSKQNFRGIRTKCSRSDCTNHFHITCAVANGSLTLMRGKNARNSPQLLLCTQHFKEKESSGSSPKSNASTLKRKRLEGESEGADNGSEDEGPTSKGNQDASTGDSRRAKLSSEAKLASGDSKQELLKKPSLSQSGSSIQPGKGFDRVSRKSEGESVEKISQDQFDSIMRAFERLSQDLRTSQKKENTKLQPAATSDLDQLMDQSFGIIEKTKANREDELRGLQAEVKALQAKLSERDIALTSLRKDLVTIFGLLKLSTRAPEELKIDEYVGIIKNMLLRHTNV